MNMNMYRNYKVFLLVCVLCFGCAPRLPKQKSTPNENISIPEKFHETTENKVTENIIIDKSWKVFIQDENLVKLIDEALQKNQELNILEQEINISKNKVIARQGMYFPKINIGAQYNKDKFSQNTINGMIEDRLNLPKKPSIYGAGLSSSWEIDIWGKLRKAIL
jgi:outer membrane protein, multidrug efflux system